MSDWNEDNFLERLAPQLRQKLRGPRGPCPDAETLCAVIEGEAAQPERDTVLAHLSQCAACADLQSRLLNFERESPPEPEAVWNQSRTRLDNWLEGFLRSEAARFRLPKRGNPSGRISIWESIRAFLTSRKIVWALSVAVGLALIVDGALLLKDRQESLPRTVGVARPLVPPKAPELSKERPKTNPQDEGFPKVGDNFPSGTESPNRPGAGPTTLPSPPPDHNLPTETAQATVPSPPNATSSPVPRPPAPALGNATAPCPTCPTAGRPLPAPPSFPRSAAPGAATRHPPRLWLEPASRLLIVVSSIHIEPDGSFQFRGTLLLPVAQHGSIPVDRGAEVIGVGTMSQGQTSLVVTELEVQGVRYKLEEGSGVMNAQTPGGGGGVDFHRSQVLDMRPATPAVYEKVPDPVEPPGPQK